jgi:pimeloyl-ACP methyl ester carboxylesterase
MKTIILPGYSPHNKEWADELKKEMHLDHEVIVHNWQHWKKGSFTIKRELKNILDEIGEGKVNILAKSVGVRIAYELMSEIPDRINKVILAGTAGAAKEENKSA